MVGTSLLVALLSDQWAAEVASWFQETKMTKSLRARLAMDCTSNLSTRLLSNSSWAVRSPLVCVLIKPLQGSGSSTLPLSFLSCSLSITFKPTCTLFASFSSSPCSCSFRRSGSRSLPLSSLSYCFSVMFKPVMCALFASFPSSSLCCSSGIMLSMRNKQYSSTMHVSFHAHAHYVPPGQTDARTNGHTDTRSDKLSLNDQMWGSLTLAPCQKPRKQI